MIVRNIGYELHHCHSRAGAGSVPRVSPSLPVRLDGPPGSAAIAGGSAEVVSAAAAILARGGSASDAAWAGALAAAMAEPALASLGGGGFMLVADPGEPPEVLDFFVDVPGRGVAPQAPTLDTVVVDFVRTGSAASDSLQVFHGGWGSVAVPGVLAGLLAAHERHGRVPLEEVVAPAARWARAGVDLAEGQRTFLHLVGDLLDLTEDSRSLFAEAHRNGHYRNPRYAALLDEVARGGVTGRPDDAFGRALLDGSGTGGGQATAADLEHYRAQWRTALSVERRGARVWTNPPPSKGGSIVVDALRRLGPSTPSWSEVAAALIDATRSHRGPGQAPTGTTHLSVVAADGSFAALTVSNGSGSGTVVPGWGVPLNNMMGEDDLQPSDGSSLAPGTRLGSMMAPSLALLPDESVVALGTGGSERIRSALLVTLVRLIDQGAGLEDAVAGARLHATGDGPLHLEPGWTDTELAGLADAGSTDRWSGVQRWPSTNLFFGGVHAVRRAADGSVEAVGDARRTGAVGVVGPDGVLRQARA